MSERPNVLFIMVDQMRADAMGCAGHPVVRTPNLDALAAGGVRFSNAYVQQAVCGPSRMCFYTGRYVHNHRSNWNDVPLPRGEQTMGDLFSAAGYRTIQCGKTHYVPDPTGAGGRLRMEGAIPWGAYAGLKGMRECELMDAGSASAPYREYLRSRGYPEQVVQYCYQIAGDDGPEPWNFVNANRGSVLRAEDTETHWLTDRAMEFLRVDDDRPWMMHLSYYRPHQPTTPSEPHASLYDPASVPPPIRSDEELDGHPLNRPFRLERGGQALDAEEAWRNFRAAYYGLITEIDDNLGRLFAFMKQRGLWDRTFIVFTSDHGEYAGDHWMFEKELWHDQAYRVPLILRSPPPQPPGDAGPGPPRNRVHTAFVESTDILPTMLAAIGQPPQPHLDGRSLLPLIHSNQTPADWREAVFADWDYRFYWTGDRLGIAPDRRRAWMVRTERHKYWHLLDLPPVLFDLRTDPDELRNVADDPGYRAAVNECRLRLLEWRMANEDETCAEATYQARPHFGEDPFTAQ